MGSNAVISVLGFMIVFGLATTLINRRNSETYENTYAYVRYTTARDIARNSIQVAVRKIDTLAVVTSGAFPVTGSFGGGTFEVDGTIINDSTIHVVARSDFENTSYTIKTTMMRRHIPFPPSALKAALGLHPTPLGSFSMQGDKDTVDGHDHDAFGHLLPASPDSVAGIMVMRSADSATVFNGAQFPTTNILGAPPIETDSTIANPDSFAYSYKGLADFVYTNGKKKADSVLTSMKWGDSTHGVIVFCDGHNPSTNRDIGGFKLNMCEGWGILVVRGNLTLAGNTTWHGLIIEYGDTVLSFNASTGNNQVYGGVLVGGAPGTTYSLGGNAVILHSSLALTLAKGIQTPYVYAFLDWYETSPPWQ